jgi:mono/diheme cytochrome c family protein
MRKTSFAAGLLGGTALIATLAWHGIRPAAAQASSPAATPAAAAAPGAGGDSTSASAPGRSLVDRGRYLAEAGDCIACHTAKGGQPFAGGRAVPTPFGTILSANITPDKTGIADWTADDFYRAMHEGVDDEGKHLYPAFPYNYYTEVTREDTDAIFAYLKTVKPVHNEVHRNQLPFPYDIRGLVGGWNLLFLHKGPYQPNPQKSAEWNRGAYLVEGLGHCEACHTPKNFLGADKHDQAFQGGSFGQWFAPDLTPNRRFGLGGWSRDELIAFLKTGRNPHSSAAGEMGEVVEHSTSHLSDGDLRAIATYLTDRPATPEPSFDKPDAAVMRQGQAIWVDSCSACHGMDGDGVPGYFPPMKGDPNLQQTDPTTVLHYILAGAQSTATDARPTPLTMAPYSWLLNDEQVAAVATYARNSWGNAAPPVSADAVHKLRAQLHFHPHAPEHGASAGGMDHPNPLTLAPADSDSRDNGTAQAGRQVQGSDQLPGASGGSGEGKGNGSGASNGGQAKGHPGGVTTGGPG